MQVKPITVEYQTNIADLVGVHASLLLAYLKKQPILDGNTGPHVSSRECAQHLGMTGATISVCLRRLVEGGFIEVNINRDNNKYPVQIKFIDASDGGGNK